jgi:hypothetical protein
LHEFKDILDSVPGLCLPSPSIWCADKQVLDFVDGIFDVDDWDVGLPAAADGEAGEGEKSGDIDELIIGPVPKPLPLKRPCNLTYAVERYWMDIRDGLQVTSKGRLFVEGAHSRYQILHSWLTKHAAKYGEVDLFDVNDKWLKGFIHYLHHQNLSLNTVSGYVDNLHAMFGNLATDGYTLAKLTVRVYPEATHFVYNSEEELKSLLNFKFSHEALTIARDIFVMQSYLGFRVGTLQIFLRSPQLYLLKDEDRWLIQIRTNKTGRIVTVPVKPIVLDILQRWNFSFEQAYYERYYNTLIKMMAREANLVNIVPYAMTYGRKRIEFRDEKWELMASHTARRNFATNAFLAHVPVEHIMFITGHTTREAFMRYIRCEGLAVAKALFKFSFFN